MQIRYVVAVLCMMLVAGLVTVRAEETDKPKKPAAAAKVVQPWSKIASLTDDQKAKIKEIRQKANEEVKVIRDKENADIMAVLTDEQKEELKTLQEKEK